MHRVGGIIWGITLLGASFCHAQSLADAARENRKQKPTTANTAAKVITSDDFSAPPDAVIQLVPGTTANGEGTLMAPGRGKHTYSVINLDASRFPSGGVLHITITMGNGASEASFDLFGQGARLPTEGRPNSLAGAYNVPTGGSTNIDYRFNHGGVFQLAAEGSWNARAGDSNTFSFVASVAR